MAGLDSFYPLSSDLAGEQRSYSSLSTRSGSPPIHRRRVVDSFHHTNEASFEDENNGRHDKYGNAPSLHQVMVSS